MCYESQKPISSNNIRKNKPSTRTELLYLRGYPKHRYVQQAASARYGPSCKSGINVNEWFINNRTNFQIFMKTLNLENEII